MNSPAFARPPSWRIARLRRRHRLISLTPLIDVVFILLVFFMLASSFLDWRSIVLSAPSAGAASAAMEGTLLVEVRPRGLRLSGRPLTLEALESRVRSRLADKPDQAIFVKPAAGVPLQRAVAVLDRLTAAGATRLSLIRDRTR
ncbi:MAG: biopolymer transporter ExbD [Thalassobaculum sp.]|uniref:ExbD/TolR family protein n=1 Tax=Thalassobaculum sp. TaxID=2022740 RepID=UPI0032ED5AA9